MFRFFVVVILWLCPWPWRLYRSTNLITKISVKKRWWVKRWCMELKKKHFLSIATFIHHNKKDLSFLPVTIQNESSHLKNFHKGWLKCWKNRDCWRLLIIIIITAPPKSNKVPSRNAPHTLQAAIVTPLRFLSPEKKKKKRQSPSAFEWGKGKGSM